LQAEAMTGPRLFHFSEDPAIEVFEPRPVRVPAERGPGREWLNGALVWAIEEARAAMYLFPRDCPRILLWPKPGTTATDKDRWWAGSTAGALAYIEAGWLQRHAAASIWRYELPPASFEDLDEAGMWVSRRTVRPIAVARIDDLPAALAAAGAELRVLPDLRPLKGVWETTLHASGIRLRNALRWDD
jgi:hypothetical protein